VEQFGNDPKSPRLQLGTYTMFATIPYIWVFDGSRNRISFFTGRYPCLWKTNTILLNTKKPKSFELGS
jgi:hypothetical protein